MVSDGDGAHAHVASLAHEPVDTATAIEHAVVRMDVQMYEILAGGLGRHSGSADGCPRRAGWQGEAGFYDGLADTRL